jgi:hypothetical protein
MNPSFPPPSRPTFGHQHSILSFREINFRFHVSEVLWYLSFCAWLISLNTVTSSSTYVATIDKDFILFMAE